MKGFSYSQGQFVAKLNHMEYQGTFTKLDTGAGGYMLTYDVWKQFFLVDLMLIWLQAYGKSEIYQLGTCSLNISHNGVMYNYHFYVVPSTSAAGMEEYSTKYGFQATFFRLNYLMVLNLVTFNCSMTTSWSSSCKSTNIHTKLGRVNATQLTR